MPSAVEMESPARDGSISRSPSPEGPSATKRKRSHRHSRPSSSSSASDSSSRSPPPARRRRSVSPAPNGKESNGSKMAPETSSSAKSKAQVNEAPTRTAETGAALRIELSKLSGTRAGGAYIPPARLRALMAEAQAADAGSKEFQRMSWDALKKSVTGLVNKVAADNIKHIVPELFGGANLIRGRGLFCRAIMKAQSLSLPFTPVFASLVAIVNTKLPMVGELLVVRLVSQFRRSFKRNDKTVCAATATFIAHLVNQRVAHEILALEILVLLLEKPTDDSVEIAVAFMREVGAFLAEESPKANNSIYDRFRAVLYEGSISKRVQYMIEVLSQVRREKYKDNPIVAEGLDLVEEEDQITHKIGLDDELKVEEGLNMFKVDADFVEHEEQYKAIKAEILGEGSSDEESGSGSEADSEDDSDDEGGQDAQMQLDIQDKTETNLVNLRRTIYLTIMSSALFEEATHKLLKLNIPEGQEGELCNMIIECCSQERTFSKFYGHIGERMSKLNRRWSGLFEECFRTYYDGIHRYETNRLRNIARFFGTLLGTDSISWASFEIIHMNEDDTTSSSRIFTKILFQEMLEILGMKELVKRFNDETMQPCYVNIFPRDNPKHTRFSVNFFTSIGLGALTEGMREHLKNVPLLLQQQRQAALEAAGGADSSSDSDSSSSLSDSDSSSVLSSSSGSYSSRSRSRSRSRSPPRRARRDAFSPDRGDSRSPPPRRRGRSPSYTPSRSRSPISRSPSPPRRAGDGRSRYDDRRGGPPPRRFSRSPISRSPSPPRRSGNGRSPGYTRRDSRSPPRRARSPISRSRSFSRSRSRSRSPPRRGGYTSSRRRSPSPPRSTRRSSPPPASRAAPYENSERRQIREEYIRRGTPPHLKGGVSDGFRSGANGRGGAGGGMPRDHGYQRRRD
ncbi:MIF4G-domain-containing protein [Microstroma glucosiphilum]|uniref:MIF4G-domain-containing protein n=1 Tax=Pseudomicrostroma glucosiphilum TaxID=1684307 RepID=A0A316UEV7_9BASI|nr:MIF4G-domain-containing protein [Pseudomicrostroma glucosiphilum]PWN23762.1 MIF4G-domain-containing protein [Pseudomicrostroma glucosiphilum]